MFQYHQRDSQFRKHPSVTIAGDRVSIRPSIGNHDFPCQSHYFITDGRVSWAYATSRAEIEAGRARDRRLKRGRKTWREQVAAGVAWLAQLLRK